MTKKWIRIAVLKALGSTPRNVGTVMYIRPLEQSVEQKGSIGGGALEYRATAIALELVHESDFMERDAPLMREFPLGPHLQQCCGGYVQLQFEAVTTPLADYDAVDLTDNMPLLIFGAGHVGQALFHALMPLPFDTKLYDQRPSLPHASNFTLEELKDILHHNPHAFVYIMTHSHQLDLELVAEIIKLNKCAHLGVIGSKSKKARFVSQLKARGYDENQIAKMHCPIGISGIGDKRPSVIAASVVAEALRLRDAFLQREKNNGRKENE